MILTREEAKLVIRARRLLLAKVVVSLRNEGQARYRKLEELQGEFELIVRSFLPLHMRMTKNLTKYVLEPAERTLKRQGVLETARQMKGWGL